MKKNYKIILTLFLFVIFLCLFFFTQAQITFEKKYPASVNQSGRDVLPTPDGGYIIAGMTETSISGDTDIYVMKTNSIGDTLWTKRHGGPRPEYAYAILPTNDGNYFITGYTASYGAGNYDIWLIKINPSGDSLWSKTYGSTGDDVGHDIIATSDGNYMLVGRSDVSSTNTDAYLMKINPSGNVIWTKYYGGAFYETAHRVKECADGGFVFIGQTFSYGAGQGDVYVVRTNSTGDSTWSKTYGGVNLEDGNDILVNNDGSLMVCAETNSFGAGDIDVYVIKTDAVGGVIWSKTYGGTDKDVSHMIQPTIDGGYIIAAISRSFGWINPDMWLVKLNTIGDTLWTRHYGSWWHDHCTAVRQTADGGYIAIGHSEDAALMLHVYFLKLDALGAVPVEELALSNPFDVYPNPASEKLNVVGSSLFAKAAIVEMYNILGKKVFSAVSELRSPGSKLQIDVNNLERGLYFLKLTDENNSNHSFVKKIILD
jgi:hypothetical protein